MSSFRGFGTPGALGALVLSFAWLRAIHVFDPPRGDFGRWIVLGTLLLVLEFRKSHLAEKLPEAPERFLLFASSVTGIACLPRPFDAGFYPLGLCALLGRPFVPLGLARSLSPGLWASALVLLAQAALLPALFALGSRLHEAPFLTPLLYYALKLLSPATMRTGETIQLVTATEFVGLTPTWEKLGLFPAVLLAVGCGIVLALRDRGLRRLPLLALLGAVYLWLRLLFLLLLVARFRNAVVFWDFAPLFASFLPFPLLASFWLRAPARPPDAGVAAALGRVSRPLAFGGFASATAFVLGAALFVLNPEPGVRKQGRVLIDEGHSDWEWTERVFDKEWYGGKSGYNYYCLVDYWSRFYHVEAGRQTLTEELLSNWDVLVLKVPTAPYSTAEIDAIESFVEKGGGLFLIGDHTNVFGSTTYLNPIAERFGMYFRYDATYSLHNLALSHYIPPSHLRHPVLRHVPEFLFATSCSVEAPLLSENVLLGYGLRAMYLDYSETSYFPTKEGKLDYLFGIFLQVAGLRRGQGRVLAFTDSTCFSNFFMFIPGKPELALGAIEWLNRSNGSRLLSWTSLALGVLGAAGVAWTASRARRLAIVNLVLAGGLLGAVLVLTIWERSAAKVYPKPQPSQWIPRVVFDGEHGNFFIPKGAEAGDSWNVVHTFYVWTQRLGLVPERSDHLQSALASGAEVVVELNPSVALELEEMDALVEHVRRGGTLIVMDTPENEPSRANDILGPFRLSFSDAAIFDTLAVSKSASAPPGWLPRSSPSDTLGVVMSARPLVGGTPLLELEDGTPVMAVTSVGEGKVVAFGASRLFGDETMGTTAVEPTPRQRTLFEVEYALLEFIAGVEPGPRYALSPPSPRSHAFGAREFLKR